MSWKKIGKAILFPHIAIMIVLVPVATVLLVFSMAFMGTDAVISYISYVLAAYTLTVWCIKIPVLIKGIKRFKDENKYARRWLDDKHLQVKITLYVSLIWNTAYAVFQLGLGFYHHTFWYISMALYYILLAIMRFFLARYTTKNKAGERMLSEFVRYRACGWILLAMNLALSLMIFFMVYWNRTFLHHEITTITLAAYTFTAFTTAIINLVKYKKYNSPIYSATRVVGLAAACVSMLTLTSTMLTTFGDGTMAAGDRKLMLALIGGAVSLFVVLMAIGMIINGTRKIRLLKNQENVNGK